jgi:hypothetical protein
LFLTALFKKQTIPVVSDREFHSNTVLRSTLMEFANEPSVKSLISIQTVQIGDNLFSYGALALVAGFLGGQTAPWTTLDYAFRPVEVSGLDSSVTESVQRVNWSVPTIGVRARASCHALDTPVALFESIEIAGSGSVTEPPVYGYELHDHTSGPLSIENSIIVNGSVFQIPFSRVGSKVRRGPVSGTIQGVMGMSHEIFAHQKLGEA